jgi:hypothetical protein
LLELQKTFEAVFLGFANGTDVRWTIPGAQIAANLAPPDRQRQSSQLVFFGFRFQTFPLLGGRAPFRD